MRASITRVAFLVAFALLSGLAGAYIGINRVYDKLESELPAYIEAACLP